MYLNKNDRLRKKNTFELKYLLLYSLCKYIIILVIKYMIVL